MKHTHIIQKITSLILIAILVLSTMLFVVTAVDPEKPDRIQNLSNRTANYPIGWKLNKTRGFIYISKITHAQPTLKWLGYVGNVTGTIALKDSSSYALFDWSTSVVTGEVYASKEASAHAGDIFGGGIPDWANVICANQTMINDEMGLFNHSITEGDRYNNTFRKENFTLKTFYAGTTLVNDTLVAHRVNDNCRGLILNVNGTRGTGTAASKWQEVVLTDRTTEDESSDSGYGKAIQYDIIYAALLENQTYGYNRQKVDFQMLLPQSGRQGNVNNVAFYFYVELI